MQANHRENLSILFSLLIIFATIYVVWEFIAPLLWAGVITLASWPLYQKINRFCRGNAMVASTLTVALMLFILALPFIVLVTELTRDVQWITKLLILANQQGMEVPQWVHSLPIGHDYLVSLWKNSLGEPGGVSALLVHGSQNFSHLTGVMRTFGGELLHRSLIFGFTFLCLFFFYKDGQSIVDHVNAMGRYFLLDRWNLYSRSLPNAINATLNGLVLVGLGVGVIMGIVYALTGVPAPALLAVITGILAMIPFAVPFAFTVAALLLVTSSKLIAALVVVISGTLVMFVADHFVRPALIGGATSLPFLAVLFGILGGVKSFGILGLFLGPIIMVLFVTLWHEADIYQPESRV